MSMRRNAMMPGQGRMNQPDIGDLNLDDDLNDYRSNGMNDNRSSAGQMNQNLQGNNNYGRMNTAYQGGNNNFNNSMRNQFGNQNSSGGFQQSRTQQNIGGSGNRMMNDTPPYENQYGDGMNQNYGQVNQFDPYQQQMQAFGNSGQFGQLQNQQSMRGFGLNRQGTPQDNYDSRSNSQMGYNQNNFGGNQNQFGNNFGRSLRSQNTYSNFNQEQEKTPLNPDLIKMFSQPLKTHRVAMANQQAREIQERDEQSAMKKEQEKQLQEDSPGVKMAKFLSGEGSIEKLNDQFQDNGPERKLKDQEKTVKMVPIEALVEYLNKAKDSVGMTEEQIKEIATTFQCEVEPEKDEEGNDKEESQKFFNVELLKEKMTEMAQKKDASPAPSAKKSDKPIDIVISKEENVMKIIEIFIQLRRSMMFEKENFLKLFKAMRHNKKREVTKDQVKSNIESYISQRAGSKQFLDDKHYEALFSLLKGTTNSERINYMEFYKYFTFWLNRKKASDQLQGGQGPEEIIYHNFLEDMRTNEYKKDLTRLFEFDNKLDKGGQKQKKLKVSLHRFRERLGLDKKEEILVAQKLKEADDSIPEEREEQEGEPMIDLMELQSLIGFDEEEAPEPPKTEDFRWICERVIILMTDNMEGIKKELKVVARGNDDKSFFQQNRVEINARDFRNWLENLYKQYLSYQNQNKTMNEMMHEFEPIAHGLHLSHKSEFNQQNMFASGQFYGNLEREMKKFKRLITFYCRIKNKIEQTNEKRAYELIQSYTKEDQESKKLTPNEFKMMLVEFGVLQAVQVTNELQDSDQEQALADQNKEYEYFMHEYDREGHDELTSEREKQRKNCGQKMKKAAGPTQLEQRWGKAIIEVDKLEEDYRFFADGPECIIDKVLKAIFQKFDEYTTMKMGDFNPDANKEMSFMSLLQEQCEEIQTKMKNDTNDMVKTVVANEWMHFMDFLRWFEEIYKKLNRYQEQRPIMIDTVNIFIDYLSRDPYHRGMLDLNFMLDHYNRLMITPELEQAQKQGNRQEISRLEHKKDILQRQTNQTFKEQLLNQIVDKLQNIDMTPEAFFRKHNGKSAEQLEETVLSKEPIKLLNLDQNKIGSIYNESTGQGKFLELDIDQFIRDLDRVSETRKTRKLVFVEIKKQLDKQGTTLENILMTIKEVRTKKELYASQIAEEDIVEKLAIFSVAGIDRTDLFQVFNSFKRDIFGMVSMKEFLDIFDQTNDGVAIAAGSTAVVKANRYFQGRANKILEKIATIVHERQLTRFGEMLHGLDINGLALRADFYNIMLSFFSPGILGKGDVLDLTTFFDQQNTGRVNLRTFTGKMNDIYVQRRIQWKVELQANSYAGFQRMPADGMKEHESESEKEELTPREFTTKQVIVDEKQQAPTVYQSRMLLDIFCGLFLNQQNSIGGYQRASNAENRDGQMTQLDFSDCLRRLQVKASQFEMDNVFEYLQKTEVASRHGGVYDPSMSIETDTVDALLKSDFQVEFKQLSINEQKEELNMIASKKIAEITFLRFIPVQDHCERFQSQRNPGFIEESDFEQLLMSFLVQPVITENIVAFLIGVYKPEHEDSFAYGPFIKKLEHATTMMKDVQLFLTKEDANSYLRQKSKPGKPDNTTKSTTGPQKTKKKLYAQQQKEPNYNQCRCAEKNTYYNGTIQVFQASQQANAALLDGFWVDTQVTPLRYSFAVEVGRYLDEVIIATRRIGQTIEHYFQKYGKVDDYDGKRYLNENQFIAGCHELGIDEGHNNYGESLAQRVFYAIAEGEKCLLVESIGNIFFFNSNVNLEYIETEALVELHNVLKQKKLIDSMVEIFQFCNFDRDGTCPLAEVKTLLVKKMKISQGFISLMKIEILLQKYADYNIPIAEEYAAESQKKKPRQQRINWYNLLCDLTYQHGGLGLKDQWTAKITEDMVKQLQVKTVCEWNKDPIPDLGLASAMNLFFQKFCSFDIDQMASQDYEKMCGALHLYTLEYEHETLKAYFTAASSESLGTNTFQTNSLDLKQLLLNSWGVQSIRTLQMQRAFEFFGRKTISQLQQEVLDKIYIVSKKLNVSAQGPRVQHMFDHKDERQVGSIDIEDFCECILEMVAEAWKACEGMLDVELITLDLRFLATRYVGKGQNKQNQVRFEGEQAQELIYVNYADFFTDYKAIEELGLGRGLNTKDSRYKDQEEEGPSCKQRAEKFRPIGKMSQQVQQFYLRLHDFVEKKNLKDVLCIDLVRKDRKEEGFLTKQEIHNVFKTKDIDINTPNMSLLCDELLKDFERFSYVEMIFQLFGSEQMTKVVTDNRLKVDLGSFSNKNKGIDVSNLQLSAHLRDQIELKYAYVNSLVNKLNRGDFKLASLEVFRVLQDSGIKYGREDLEVLQTYLEAKKLPNTTNSINWQTLLIDFRIQKDSSVLLVDLCKHLESKQINLNTFTEKWSFNMQELSNLFAKFGFPVKSRQKTFEKMFLQISERRSEIGKAMLIRIINEAQADQNEMNKKGDFSQKRLPTAPHFVKQFIHFVLNNKINLLRQFPEGARTNRIYVSEFVSYLDEIKARFTAPGDRQNMINFFSDQKNKFLDFKKLIAYIKSVDQNYGLDVGSGQHSSGPEYAKQLLNGQPPFIQETFAKFVDYLEKHKLKRDQIFVELDSNKNGLVEMAELQEYFGKGRVIPGFMPEDVTKLYNFMDANGDGFISLNEMKLLLEGSQESVKDRMKSFSPEFDLQMKTNIKKNFDKLDKNNSGSLDPEEFHSFFAPYTNDMAVTLEKARQVISTMDSNGNGRISLEEFTEYVMYQQKLSLIKMEDSMEDVRALFREQVASQAGEGMKKQTLNERQLKQLVIKIGYAEITDEEVLDMFDEMDADDSKEVDIDEVMAFLYLADRIKTKKTSTRDTVFTIRSSILNLNHSTLMDIFQQMPATCTPSFTQKELEKLVKHLPSSALLPQFDMHKMQFKEFSKLNGQDNMPPAKYIEENRPKNCLEVQLVCGKDGIEGIPVPQGESILVDHAEVRCVLFHRTHHTYLSNFLIIPAKPQLAKNKKPLKAGQGNLSTWQLRDSTKTFVGCCDQVDPAEIHILFEFVVYCEVGARQLDDNRGDDRKIDLNRYQQVSVGWASLSYAQAATGTDHKMLLHSESPFADGAFEQETGATKKSLLKSVTGIFKGKSGDEKFISVKTKTFAKIEAKLQHSICSLPANCLVLKPLVSFAETFRLHCREMIGKAEMELRSPKLDLTITQFAKVYDCPEFHLALSECWPLIVKPGEELATLQTFVAKLYALLYKPALAFEHVYTTRSMPWDSPVHTTRFFKAREALLEGQVPKGKLSAVAPPLIEQAPEGAIEFLDDYQPFTVTEIGAQGANNSITGLDFGLQKKRAELTQQYQSKGQTI